MNAERCPSCRVPPGYRNPKQCRRKKGHPGQHHWWGYNRHAIKPPSYCWGDPPKMGPDEQVARFDRIVRRSKT